MKRMGNAYSKFDVECEVSIYKISSELTDLIYVGSTTKKLNERLCGHRYEFTNRSEGKCTSFKIFEIDPNCSIDLIEECNEENRYEREGWWVINTPNCVNKYLPGRTWSEYYRDNKEKINEQKAKYRANNKEQFDEYQAQYHINNKEKIDERRAQYYQYNKEKIAEKSAVKFDCPCGGRYTHSNKSIHKLCKKHKTYLKK